MKQRVGILSLGCPRNLVDSESIVGALSLKGHRVVDMDKAQVAIINTCAFIEEAKQESIDAIFDLVALKKEGKLKRIIVYGCLAQRYKDLLRKELPEVDAFIGKVSLDQETIRFPITPGHFAYLKICEGCINNCSYCVIPAIKGRFTSLDERSILNKVKLFNKEKISELNIIGQDITGYGLDLQGKTDLVDIVRKISKNSGNIAWIRLLYLNPERVTDELLKLIAGDPKICKYIDLPVQHISSRILKLMNRKIIKAGIIKLIEKARKVVPQVALRTSVIVGMPSETDKEFKQLLKFIKEVKFERLGAFIYSREEGTPAYSFKGQIPKDVKLERFNQVMSLQQEISQEVNSKFLGRSLEVLIDESQNHQYIGRSQYDAPEVDGMVYVNSKNSLKSGDFVKVNITDTLEYDLVGDAE
ncbi:MAG: MiaB/RimO family radical SAM methylthiotransferase [Candidatus Omnitrophica bacterium]|nr:MiaB/RimO family radical SAM methylthiotransferase [Candidatus Omnitrophota bacterium]